MSSSYATEDKDLPEACVGCALQDARATATEMLLQDLPISVWTDKTNYSHDDMIIVKGKVANVASGFPVTVTVVSPLNSIVTVDQIPVTSNGDFETMLNTTGNLWKYDGTYTIKVNYGSVAKNNSAKVELTGGIASTPDSPTSNECGVNEISANGQCIPFTISGGTVTSAIINTDDNSIIININAEDDGILTISPSEEVIKGIFMVLVDGEEWDDAEIVTNTNEVTVMFPAGAEQVEVIGTFVIPEFGTIAAMILAVAIISIIAVSARSRLSIMPRY
ncbi:MAG: PEFG-CTERM sorting domain-containing protein [Nitrosopumilus sp.]|uniref:PEFG-CTERM sorting domain-containing protein n=1 Tax=Nitrosopumilus sp. TaxID=2024843 RepID=UPI002930204E|nr:PEFG-CTERM sorting domain-containing protein [Nitrosopumilus sp.]